MKKFAYLLLILLICQCCHAEEKVTLRCDWNEETQEAFSRKVLEKAQVSTIFILDENNLYNSRGEVISNANIEEKQISFTIDTSNSQNSIQNTYIINRMSGSIKYLRDYKPKGYDADYRVITKGNGRCKRITNERLF